MNHLDHFVMHEARQRDLLAEADADRIAHLYELRHTATSLRLGPAFGRGRRAVAGLFRLVADLIDPRTGRNEVDSAIEERLSADRA